ncbi:hypothetical protein Lnau_0322 [Legionella nautarum]|uniref:Uncharacterized protein n=1 Tax=Legionella nautarum TaxID=45070 RepID=A0A0W0X3G2_9GAMM|nr:hypothetical protein [Legionella nautarum]KTD39123.1 hypothetical protein Lnau_0322 [Legionella nautarum]
MQLKIDKTLIPESPTILDGLVYLENLLSLPSTAFKSRSLPKIHQQPSKIIPGFILHPGEPNSRDRYLFLVIEHIGELIAEFKKTKNPTAVTPRLTQEFMKEPDENLGTTNPVLTREFMTAKLAAIDVLIRKLAQCDKNTFLEQQDAFQYFFILIGNLIPTLTRCNYLEEIISIEKRLHKIADGILSEISQLKKQKPLNSFSASLKEYLILFQSELACCYSQKKDINAALLHSAEAYDAISSQGKLTKESSYLVIYYSLLSLYYLQVDLDIQKAKNNIDRVLKINSTKVFTCSNLVAHACNQLSTQLFFAGRYEESLDYAIHELDFLKKDLQLRLNENMVAIPEKVLKKVAKQTSARTCSIWIDDLRKQIGQVEQRISLLKLKIFKEKKATLVSFLDTLQLRADKPYEFNLQTNQLFIHIKDEHCRFARKFFTIKGKPPVIELAVMDLNLHEFRKKYSAFQKLVEKASSTTLVTTEPKEQISPRSSTPNHDSYFLMTEQFEQSKPARNKKPKKIKQEASSESEASSGRRPKLPNKPASIAWKETGKIYGSDSEQDPVYALSRLPQIPLGRWYAYLDTEKIILECEKEKQDEQAIIKSIVDILGRGLISNNGTGIAFAIRELKGTGYICKIRLLGEHGKGDIRIYGRIAETTTDMIEGVQKTRQLICFDHIAFHAHKNNKLPNIEQEMVKPEIGIRKGF